MLLAFGITLIAFSLTNLVPADPVLANIGIRASENPAIVKAFREHYGLDKPLPVQYGLFLLRLSHGDLGQSEQSHRPVAVDLGEYIPATAELAISSMLVAIICGMGLGTLAAMRRNRLIDHLLRIVSLSGTSIPPFWLALVALYLFFFQLGWVPSSGRLDAGLDAPSHVTGLYTVDALLAGNLPTFLNALQHLVLPTVVLAIYNIGVLIRFTRASVLEVLNEEYITVARAKGLSNVAVLRHILRSALSPVVTVVGFSFADLMTGTVLVETIFAWPGVGRYAFHSATTLDLPAILGITLFISIVFVTVNFAVDVLYRLIDPRLRLA